VRVTILLADAVQAVEGKLYILGGGWSVAGPGATPMAIAVKIEVPWSQTNTRHVWQLDLLDADGAPVPVPGVPDGPRPLLLRGDFEVGRPPGLPPGTPIDLPLAINLGPLQLPPACRYLWRFSVDGVTHQDWQVAFTTRPAT